MTHSALFKTLSGIPLGPLNREWRLAGGEGTVSRGPAGAGH